MSSSNRSIGIFITCGKQKKYTTISSAQVKMDEIHQQARNLFGILLPESYFIKIYNAEINHFINLNQNELDYGYNPFRLNLSADDQDLESMPGFVDLYVDAVSPVNSEMNTPTSLLCQEIVSPDHYYSSTLVVNEQECQQELPLSSNTTNDNPSHSSDLFNGLLDSEQADISENFLSSFIADLLVNNDATDGHVSEEIPNENVIRVQNNLSISIQNSNICPNSVELTEVENTELDRLDFSVDVKPTQKDIYKSDRYNQKNKNKINGHIARVQGIKTGKPAKSSVLPKIRIPRRYRNKPNLWLDTYVVSEQSQDGKRIWIKHRDKGFLPKDYTRVTPPVNPISFALNENDLTQEGDFKLALPMTTMWNKSESLEEEEVYKLDEHAAIHLHPAANEPSSPRLFCVLRQNNVTLWDTACLSDYIRSTKARKRGLTADQNNAKNCKRARAK